MEEDIRALLLASAGVTAICGTRINFGAHPQGQPLPAVVLNTAADVQGVTMAAPEGHSEALVQVDSYGETYASSKSLARAVRSVLSGYSGGDILGVFEVASRDTREDGSTEPGRPYRVSADYTVRYYLS